MKKSARKSTSQDRSNGTISSRRRAPSLRKSGDVAFIRQTPGSETPERILVTAELMFAERGYGALSLRAITRAAGVNLAAIHYHFGSKEELLERIFERRCGPMNQE